MPKKTETEQPIEPPAPTKHTQTIMAEALPALTSMMRSVTRARPGQPTKRSPELVEEMCLDMACGDSLLMVCQRADMPGYSTVMRWCNGDPELLALFDKAREMTAYTIDEVNELIARGIEPFSTGEFRRDEMLVAINNQRKRHLNQRRFGDKQTVDLNSTINIAVPEWVNPTRELVEDGQLLDPDLMYEQSTVERITTKPERDCE
jgi:hypothetical protein